MCFDMLVLALNPMMYTILAVMDMHLEVWCRRQSENVLESEF